jgi:hypothetical protein
MKHAKRRWWIITLSLAMVATLGIVISLLVLGGPERDFTATAYSDVIRFEADSVATLRVRIFDLSGKEVWDSGVVSGDIVDWDRRNDTGERLAYGAYIYSAQGWNAEGDLIFQKNGKLALMPGDKVQLQAAPVVSLPQSDGGLALFKDEPFTFQPMAVNVDHSTESWAFGQVGIGTTSPNASLEVMTDTDRQILLQRSAAISGRIWGKNAGNARFMMGVDGNQNPGLEFHRGKTGYNQGFALYIDFAYADDVDYNSRFIMWDPNLLQLTGNASFAYTGSGNVGIGTSNTTAKLTIEASSGDLIAAYNSSGRVFVVENNGTVRADGAYYSGVGDCSTGGFNAGGADVAERVNVSEWVEAGCVVEIDPAHPGFFRKPSSPYSTKVAGIISTSPGVILGNSFDKAADDWEDNRPVLAVAGRVPLQVTAENGPIQIGDLLVSSSTPGVAMKGSDSQSCIGAVIGKAMEPLKEGEGTIVAQVMLR